MASQPQRSRSRSRDDSDADPPRRDPEREQLERDLDDLERWKETGELPPGYDSREQLERDLADLSRLNDQRELPPGYSYLPPRPPPPPRRFQRSDRVVCSLGGGFGWLPGAVQSVNEPNPQDPMEVFPYVVKLDPPLGKLISVPEDRKNFCRSEICFDGDVPGGAQFSIACLPLNPTKKRRFAGRWAEDEEASLKELVKELGDNAWDQVAERLGTGRSARGAEQHWEVMRGTHAFARKRKGPPPKAPPKRRGAVKLDKAALEARMAADGWTKEEKPRESSSHVDKYWIDPKDGKKCRSIIEVARKAYPDMLEEAPQRPKKEPSSTGPLACRKGCGRCFGNSGARGSHELHCDGTPKPPRRRRPTMKRRRPLSVKNHL